MAERNQNIVQLDFPELTNDLIEQLQLKGVVGLLDFLDTVQPTYIVAARPGLSLATFEAPIFASAEVFSGHAADPVANTVIADTGQLAAGTYNVQAQIGWTGLPALDGFFEIQHRNAANAATLSRMLIIPADPTFNSNLNALLPLIGYTIALNERIRAISPTSNTTGDLSATIYASVRPVP